MRMAEKKKQIAAKRQQEMVAERPQEVAAKKQRLICNLAIPDISTQTGFLLVCGTGDTGQLGLGNDVMERKSPTINSSVKDVVDVCAGGMHSLCLTKTGQVYSFGCNDEGALGRSGDEYMPAMIDLPGKCVKMSAGDSHSAFLLEDGRVFACGSFRGSNGSIGLTLDGIQRLPLEVLPGKKSCGIASGADHLVILTCNGKVYTAGCAEQGQLGRVTLRSASGNSRRGKSEILTPNFVSIKKGKLGDIVWATNYCTFVKEFNSNKIYAFGLNNFHQLGIDGPDGVVSRPMETNMENVSSISGGQHHTIILTMDKKCWAIGKKDYGRLGLGEVKIDIKSFEEIQSLRNKKIEKIACGDQTSFAVTYDGNIYAWGMGTNNQLGCSTDGEDKLEPTLLTSKSIKERKCIKVSSGGQHTLFLVEDKPTKQSNGQITTGNPLKEIEKPNTNGKIDTSDKEMLDEKIPIKIKNVSDKKNIEEKSIGKPKPQPQEVNVQENHVKRERKKKN